MFKLRSWLLVLVLLVTLVPSALADLPPRPEPSVPAPAGGTIVLSASPVTAKMWTLIQWQDAFGKWHDVQGWQGTFEPGGKVQWWVGAENLGQGPFHWLVYSERDDGDLLATSDPFDLPAYGGQRVLVELTLEP